MVYRNERQTTADCNTAKQSEAFQFIDELHTEHQGETDNAGSSSNNGGRNEYVIDMMQIPKKITLIYCKLVTTERPICGAHEVGQVIR